MSIIVDCAFIMIFIFHKMHEFGATLNETYALVKT